MPCELGGLPPVFLLRFSVTMMMSLLLAGCGGGGYEGYKDAPYTVRGQRYYPMSPQQAVGHVETGTASHYRGGFLVFPGKTAIGERIFPWSKGAAHKTLPLPCRVRVTNLENGRHTVVRVNDRGPFIGDRAIDMTEASAKKLGFHSQGLAPVRIEVLSVGDGRYRLRR
ncbi:MAG: septal ring lytic transglycosylase RlpA family protein [Chthoniobacterales bacterium]|nr:septal ring lytic transglycosylase RlpA family protein [Chthoniobacterales bacterium]